MPAVGQRIRQRVPAGVLIDGHQRRRALPVLEHFTHPVSRRLGGNHAHVHVGRRHDLAEANVEAVGEHQRLAGRQVRLDAGLVDARLGLVGDDDHDDVGLGSRLVHRLDGQAGCFRLGPALGVGIETDPHIDAAVAQVERVGVALAAVADDGYLAACQPPEISVLVVVDSCHESSGLWLVG
ncbi:MAG: hypothetical protein R2844_08975 [Caldilineales bacterium]